MLREYLQILDNFAIFATMSSATTDDYDELCKISSNFRHNVAETLEEMRGQNIPESDIQQVFSAVGLMHLFK